MMLSDDLCIVLRESRKNLLFLESDSTEKRRFFQGRIIMEKMGGKQGGIMLESYFHLYKKGRLKICFNEMKR